MCAAPTSNGINRLFNQLKETVTCVICQDVMNDPVDACPQRHTFCRVCIMQQAEYRPKCPHCRQNLLPMQSLQVNRLMQTNIDMYRELEQEATSLEQRVQAVVASESIASPISLVSRESASNGANNAVSTDTAARTSAAVQARIAPATAQAPVVPRHPIFDAVTREDEAAVTAFIQDGVSVNQVDASGNYPIFYAKTATMIRLFLRAGALIRRAPLQRNLQNDRLFEALRQNDFITVKDLIQNGLCNIEAIKDKQTVLICAICNPSIYPFIVFPNNDPSLVYTHGQQTLLLLLIRAGADVNIADENGGTPLFHACMDVHGDQRFFPRALMAMNILIDAGANINARNKHKTTILARAAAYNRIDIMQLLLSKGASLETVAGETTPLHFAVLGRHIEATEFLLNAGVNIDAQNNRGDTPLHLACDHGDDLIEITKRLLGKRPNLNLTNKHGETPLLVACKNKSVKTAQLLIKGGANLHLPDRKGVTPLEYMKRNAEIFQEVLATLNLSEANLVVLNPAMPSSRFSIFDAVLSDDVEMVKLFIKKGVLVNQADADGNSPIFYANSNEMIELLLRAGAKVKRLPVVAESQLQVDRFFTAIGNGNLVVIKELLENGFCDVNSYKKGFDTPFRFSMKNSSIVMLLLLRAGADTEHVSYVNITSGRSGQQTPLGCLLTEVLGVKDREEKVEMLLRGGANINAKLPGRRFTLNGSAQTVAFVEVPTYCRANIIKLFLQRGANVNIQDEEGWTALHNACRWCDLDAVQVLVEAGAAVNARDMHKLTPLYHAAECNKIDVIKYLLSKGASLASVMGQLTTPLHQAIRNGHGEAADLLITAKADINALDDLGATALCLACELGEYRLEMIKLLVNRKANVNLPNKFGDSPLIHACRAGSLPMAQLLIESGAEVKFCDKRGVSALEYMEKNKKVFGELLAKLNSTCVIC